MSQLFMGFRSLGGIELSRDFKALSENCFQVVPWTDELLADAVSPERLAQIYEVIGEPE